MHDIGTPLRKVTVHRRQDMEDSATVRFERIHQTLEIGGVGRHVAAVAPVPAPTVDGEAGTIHHDIPGIGN